MSSDLLDGKGNYKNLHIPETDSIRQAKMKKRIIQENLKQTRKLLET